MAIEDELPEYRDALERERKIRGAVFLDLPYTIQGIELRQITPRILAMLAHVNNPFINGGDIGIEDVFGFLWICAVDFKPSIEARDKFLIRNRAIDWEDAGADIMEFVDVTFFDANLGGEPCTPYVSSIATILYKMHRHFGWDTARTMDQPLRLIYQLLRCQAFENRVALINPLSDKVLADEAAKLQSATRSKSRSFK